MTRFSSAISAAFLVFLVSGCSKASIPSEQDNPDPTPGTNTGTNPGTSPGTNTGGNKSGLTPPQQSDWNAIEQLEAQSKALAVIDGCPSSSDCRSAPVGSRACGGPRYYIPYCAKTTDSVALYKKLAEVSAAEQAYNKKYNLASTCEFRMPPVVESSAGSCVAK
ncbi:MAG: hypothetical protein ABI556_12355 [Gemmatimonadales bacterium]